MCGIYGILAMDGSPSAATPETLRAMGALTAHRGPDDEGAHIGPGIALGMRRLSIIDLAGGHQPMSTADGSVWVVCNGEIYNFRELRRELEARGHAFRTHSDTEVVLRAYVEYGDGLVDHLRGMFAFAVWDAPRRRLILGRDRLGIKPLYYQIDRGRLVFASEIKTILGVPGIEARVDPAALRQYLALGYPPAPCSMFQGIHKLPVASLLSVEDGQARIRRYWQLPAAEAASLRESEWVEALRDALEQSVVSQMVSDVPIGAFLSGGIDSSAVVGFMARHSPYPVRTYSIGFDLGKADRFYNELPYAREMAQRFGTQHREILVRPNVAQLLPELLWHMDEPIADSAFITTYLVAKFAREDVSVILSGVGGDELFGGYRRYLGEHYGRYYRRLPRAVRERLLPALAARLPADRHSSWLNASRLVRSFVLSGALPFEGRYRAYVGVFDPESLDQLLVDPAPREQDALDLAFAGATQGDPLRTLFEVDLATQLPDDLLLLTDKMTMATSLECRVPLLDERLVDLAARMPSQLKIRGGSLKYLLKKALGTLLPPETLERKKRGFGAPIGAWIRDELAPLVGHLLSREAVEARGWFRPDGVARTIDQHRKAERDHTDHLLALINLELWARIFLDQRAPADLAAECVSELSA